MCGEPLHNAGLRYTFRNMKKALTTVSAFFLSNIFYGIILPFRQLP
jgi:hypothetical protein